MTRIIGTDLQISRRNLPHWQIGGSVYFVTFRSIIGDLSDRSRRIVAETALGHHGQRYRIHGGVVMPDHVHLIIQPMEMSAGKWYELQKILKSIKGVSARRINESMGRKGSVWQAESFDRIVRDEKEYLEKMNYILRNPIKARIVSRIEDYPYFIVPPE